ncbi:MAG: hypothetical protein ABJD66_11580 [Cellulophaga sp.]|uniref:hypothetical protein n=1 Tax=unclassified Cellulophaga TaxID=2634405 RepID=UPI0012FDAEEC|nr:MULTISPECIES: hypothetical protein [unclassified Cellulophaga]MDO6491654.1 hypothetical protein [Cellulophaga sp. 2_MG-2023]MDO6493531.1 hypothetical protein [Cellulophaga sp. 3_MG-2023]
MGILKEIIHESAIGNKPAIYKAFVISVFISIVLISFTMLTAILRNPQQVITGFGY